MSEVTSVNGKTGAVVLAAGDVEAIPTAQAGAANGVATLNASTQIPVAQLPSSVVSGSQFLISIKNHDAESGKDCTAAIEAAQKEAEELPGNYGVFFPAGTWEYRETLLYRVPWVGVPRKSILKRTSTFTYSGLLTQFSILNVHAATTYNASTADTVIVRGVDFEIEGTSEAGKGSFGLANVAGGEIWDCRFKTNGTNGVGALIDVYACVKNLQLDVQCENLTGAKTGGNLWIRNLAAKPEEAPQVTENIYVGPRSSFATTTGDEAVAVYGVLGLVRNVLIDRATLVGAASAEKHQRLASTFPSSNSGANKYAAVEDVEWRGCKFVDIEGTLKESGEVLAFGRSTDSTNICQNIRHVDCTFAVKVTTTKVAVTRNIPCKYEGETSGNAAVRPYINAEGSTEPVLCGVEEYPIVEGGVTVGNILQACRRCNKVTGGIWEATEKVFYDCNSIGGDYQVEIPNATGTVFYREANEGTWSGVASYGKGEITGGKSLLVVHSTVTSTNTISLTGVTITTTAESGNLIETPTEGSIPVINLRNNVATGPKALARKGTFAQAEGNAWYGVFDEASKGLRLLLPTNIRTCKEPGATTTEERPAIAEYSTPTRDLASTNILLTSGTPLLALIPVPAHKVIHGVGFGCQIAEGTPANRTHLWVALLNSKLEVLRRGLDYTSSANTSITATAMNALLLEESYETKAEEALYALVVEVMSSTNPITILGREPSVFMTSAKPQLGGVGNAGQTTPAELPGTVTLGTSKQIPWLCFV